MTTVSWLHFMRQKKNLYFCLRNARWEKEELPPLQTECWPVGVPGWKLQWRLPTLTDQCGLLECVWMSYCACIELCYFWFATVYGFYYFWWKKKHIKKQYKSKCMWRFVVLCVPLRLTGFYINCKLLKNTFRCGNGVITLIHHFYQVWYYHKTNNTNSECCRCALFVLRWFVFKETRLCIHVWKRRVRWGVFSCNMTLHH